MAITVTFKSSLFSTTGATTYTASPTWTPTANCLLVACVLGDAAAPANPSGVTGHGVTFSRLTLGGTTTTAANKNLSIWVAKAGAAPSSVACVATFAGSQLGGGVIEFEVVGAEVSGTAAQAIVISSDTATGAAGTSATLTLTAASDPDNRPLIYIATDSNAAPTAAGSWTITAGAAGNWNNDASGMAAAFNNSTFDTAGAFTKATGVAWRMVGIEIKAAMHGAVGSLTLDGVAPTLAQGTIIAPTVGALTCTGNAAVVTQPSGSVSITPSVGALTLTGGIGNEYEIRVTWIQLQVPEAITKPAVGALSFTGIAPTVSASGGGAVTRAPLVGTLTLTGLAPSLLKNNIVTPTVGAASFTGIQPTVISAITLKPTVAALTLAGVAPALLSTFTIAPSAGSLTLTGNAAGGGANSAITAQAGTLAFAGYAPAVIRNVLLQGLVGSLTLTGYASTLIAGTLLVPQRGALSLTGSSSLIDRTLIASIGSLVMGGYQPSVNTSNAQQSVPGSGQLSLTGFAPDVVGADNHAVTPVAGAIALVGGLADIKRANSVTPSSGTLSLAGTQAQVTRVDTVTPAAGSLTLISDQAQVTQAETVAPSAAGFALTGQQAQIVLGKNITSSAGSLTLAGDPPTVSSTANELVTPDAGTLDLAGESAEITSSAVTLIPGSGVLGLDGLSPALSKTGAAIGGVWMPGRSVKSVSPFQEVPEPVSYECFGSGGIRLGGNADATVSYAPQTGAVTAIGGRARVARGVQFIGAGGIDSIVTARASVARAAKAVGTVRVKSATIEIPSSFACRGGGSASIVGAAEVAISRTVETQGGIATFGASATELHRYTGFAYQAHGAIGASGTAIVALRSRAIFEYVARGRLSACPAGRVLFDPILTIKEETWPVAA